MRKRVWGIIMSLILFLSYLPMEGVYAEGTQPAPVYVSGEGSDDHDGATASTAVKSINHAIEIAEEGATIYVEGSVYIEPLGNGDNPLIINKAVNIVGTGTTTLSVINVRAGGVILGADVTFQNLTYAPGSFIRPGIAANGHTLTLINVRQDASTRPLQIYGGTLYDITETIDFGAAYVGGASVINIVGGSYEAVYAGSVNGDFGKGVTINVSKGEYSLDLDGVYAAGTQKIQSSVEGSIPVLTDEYSVGNVTINLSDVSVRTVSGVKDCNYVSLAVSSENMYSPTIDNIDNLIVNSGVFAPVGTWNNQMNVTLSGNEEDKATLDLSGFTTALQVQNFTDNSAPNILVLPTYKGTEASLLINGKHTGTTELRTGGGMPWSSEEYPGYSGMMEYEHTYVTAASGEGSFVIVNPNGAQGGYDEDGVYSGINLEKSVDEVISWTTSAEEEKLAELVSFSIEEEELAVAYEDINLLVSGAVWPVLNLNVEFTADSYYEDISFIPISYKVTYGDKVYEFTTNDEVYIYNIEALNLCLDAYADVLYMYKMEDADGNVAAGEYGIQMTVPTTNGMVMDSFILVVQPEEGAASPSPTPSPTPEPTATPSPTPEPTASPSPEPTASPTPSPSPEPTASPSPSPEPTATPSPSPSPSPSPTPSPSPEPTASPSPSPTPEPTATPSPSPTPEPTPAPTATPENQVRAFVERMYTVALGRDADPSGCDFWTGLLLGGNNDGAGLAEEFLLGNEFKNKNHSDGDYVDVLYATFFDREPATEEVSFWTATLQQGFTREYVLAGFVNSPEFFDLCSGYGISRGTLRENGEAINPGIGRFAERLYTKVLERSGDEVGVEYWTIVIADGTSTPELAAQNFFSSPEYLARNTTDEEYIKALYRTFMDRECDESGIEFWKNTMNSGATRESVLKGFAESPEFKEIMARYGL